MGLLDRLMGERNARAMQDVYDRTAQAANRGYGAAVDTANSTVDKLKELDAARVQMAIDNEAKRKAGDMWYQKANQGIGQFVDTVQGLTSQIEAYRQSNLQKQGREDPLQGIRRFFS
jgi:phosphoenolpyruvate carboxylase